MRKLTALVLLLVSMNCWGDKYGNITVSRVVSIYDGDTFRVDIDAWPDIIGKNIRIKTSNIDTPEIRGKCSKEKKLARLAKQFTVEQLRTASGIELRNMQRGKYFRIVADVYVNGKNLSDLLVQNQLAVVYDGQTKTKDWCD